MNSAAPESPFIIMSTDIGHDPDDAISLAIAARRCPRLCVVTCDETRGRRARMAKRLLELMDRPDVPVIEGVALGGDHRFRVADDLLAPENSVYPAPLAQELADRIADADGPVVWVGQGPMRELVYLLTEFPHLSERISLVQMGGWFDRYRNKSKASHNFDVDKIAAGIALRLAHRPALVLSDHTNVAEIAIGPETELYTRMLAPSASAWERLVAANFAGWWTYQRARDAAELTRMHDPLTLSAGLGEPFVSFAPQRISIARDGRIKRDPDGRDVRVSEEVAYTPFNAWMYEAVA